MPDCIRFVTSDMSATRGNREAEPTKHTANGAGSDYDNVERGLYNNNNNNNNNNVIKKEANKILKYKDLTIEIQRMWNVKTKVIPVIIGATGTF